MEWTVSRTDTFVESLSKVKDNKEVIIELGKKLHRLKQAPLKTDGWLSGALHGKRATRIEKCYRLIFLPGEREKTVYLIAIDHRRHVYRLR